MDTTCCTTGKFPVEGAETRPAMVLQGQQGVLGPALEQALRRQGREPLVISQDQKNGGNGEALCRTLESERPGVLFYCLGQPCPDRSDPEPRQAFYWNKELPRILAHKAAQLGAGFVYFSSDCVFDGHKQLPYTVADMPNPLSVYGQSLWAGERALQECRISNLLIVRTSWLFGPFGPNFVDQVMQQAQEERLIQVAHDQIGSPTYSLDLAKYVLQMVDRGASGIYHVCNSGQASWCELAAEALNTCGLNCLVQAVNATADSSPQIQRPQFAVLDTSRTAEVIKGKPRPWPLALREYIFTYQSQHIDY